MKMRAHPLMIASYFRRYAALLLLPPIRSAVTLAVSGYLPGIWISELVVAAALLIGCTAKWLTATLTLSGGQLSVTEGLLVRRTGFMSTNDAVTINVTANPIAALLGARRVAVFAPHRKPLCSIYLSRQNAERLIEAIGYDDSGYVNQFSAPQLLVAAVADSSLISGLILAYTAYGRAKYLSALNAEPIINEAVGAFEGYLPRTLSLITVLLLVGYATALAVSVARLALLKVRLNGRSVTVSSGILTRRRSYIFTRKIATVTVKTPIIMRLFGRCSVSIGAAGFGSQRGQSKVILPAVHYRSGDGGPAIAPSPRANRRAYLAPAVWLALLLTCTAVVAAAYPPLRFAAAVAAIVTAVYMWSYIYARIDAQRHGRLLLSDKITINGRRGTAATETSVDREGVAAVTLISGPFDRRLDVCTIRFYPTVGGEQCKIKNIDCNSVDISHQI